MVIRYFLFTLLLSLSLLSQAQNNDPLKVEVDRTQIQANETLTLSVTVPLDLGSSPLGFLGGLSALQAPDFAELSQDWRILGKDTSTNVRINNNQNLSESVWRYTLAPKTSGSLSIPALSYQQQRSQPIAIQVTPASQASGRAKTIFLEVDVDSQTPYIQQQVLYTLRLFVGQPGVRGELSHPDHQDALVVQLSENKYERSINRRTYQVYERKYAVFPQQLGQMTLPEISFIGNYRDLNRRTQFRVAETAPAITLEVQPPPAAFNGTLWLPAQQLELSQSLDNTALTLAVGDALTREVTLSALGLEGVQLPPLAFEPIDGLKFYPEPGEQDTQRLSQGLQGVRTERTAIVAVTPGQYTLPAIELPWWDVQQNQQRIARLPAVTLTVLAAEAPAEIAPVLNTSAPVAVSSPQPLSWLWPSLAAAFALAWLITLYAWWRKAPLAVATPQAAPTPTHSDLDLSQLDALSRQDPQAFLSAYAQWLNRLGHDSSYPKPQIQALQQQARPLLNQLQRQRYGQGANQGSDNLASGCQQLIQLSQQLTLKETSTLPPLYPN